MIGTKVIKTLGVAAAVLFSVAMVSEASAGARGGRHHGGGFRAGHAVKHGHAIGHRGHFGGYRGRGLRTGLYAAAGFGVGYAAGGSYTGYGVTYAQPEASYAEPAYAAPAPQSYVRTYQVPVTVNRAVTRTYQQPVTSYQTEYRTEYVPVRRAYQRPVTVMQTYQRQEIVPTTEYRTVQKRCNCSWDY